MVAECAGNVQPAAGVGQVEEDGAGSDDLPDDLRRCRRHFVGSAGRGDPASELPQGLLRRNSSPQQVVHPAGQQPAQGQNPCHHDQHQQGQDQRLKGENGQVDPTAQQSQEQGKYAHNDQRQEKVNRRVADHPVNVQCPGEENGVGDGQGEEDEGRQQQAGLEGEARPEREGNPDHNREERKQSPQQDDIGLGTDNGGAGEEPVVGHPPDQYQSADAGPGPPPPPGSEIGDGVGHVRRGEPSGDRQPQRGQIGQEAQPREPSQQGMRLREYQGQVNGCASGQRHRGHPDRKQAVGGVQVKNEARHQSDEDAEKGENLRRFLPSPQSEHHPSGGQVEEAQAVGDEEEIPESQSGKRHQWDADRADGAGLSVAGGEGDRLPNLTGAQGVYQRGGAVQRLAVYGEQLLGEVQAGRVPAPGHRADVIHHQRRFGEEAGEGEADGLDRQHRGPDHDDSGEGQQSYQEPAGQSPERTFREVRTRIGHPMLRVI